MGGREAPSAGLGDPRKGPLGPAHPEVGRSPNNLGGIYGIQGRFAKAEEFLKRSLAIREKALRPEHPELVNDLGNYAVLLRDTERPAEARKLEARMRAIHDALDATKVKDAEHLLD